MKILDTQNIEDFPEHIIVGYSKIVENLGTEILTEEELEEWSKFRSETRKKEYLTARYLFRFLLNNFDISDNYILRKDVLGKPFATYKDKYLYVNFSHSNNLVLCAISERTEIGIDIEHEQRKMKPALMDRILSEEDKRNVGTEESVLLWTVKEAIVKRIGLGIRTNLNEITLRKIADKRFTATYKTQNDINVISFTLLEHRVSVAY